MTDMGYAENGYLGKAGAKVPFLPAESCSHQP